MKQHWKKIVGIAAVLALIVGIGIWQKAQNTAHSASTFAMSTVVTQQVYGPQGEQAIRQVNDALAEFEARLTLFSAQSEIGELNAAAGQHPVEVSEETFELIRYSLELSLSSQRAFQISIAPLTQLWGITTDHPRVPSSDEIAAVLPLIDDESIQLDEAARTIFLPEQGQAIDLGGIAKGNACDLAARIYEDCGVHSAILNIGGNVYVRGRAPDGDRFRVGFRVPEQGSSAYLASVELEDQVMAVSGGYERYFEDEEGNRYHHILSPLTGYPAQSDIVSVGVICTDGTRADFLSTTLFVWGEERTRQFMAQTADVGVILLNTQGELIVSRALEDSFQLSETGKDYPVIFI